MSLLSFKQISILLLLATIPLSAYADDNLPFVGTPDYPLGARTALVIGISELEQSNGFLPLTNPERDAHVVSEGLTKAGFSVLDMNDDYPPNQMTRQNIKKELYKFADILRVKGGVGVVYFAGHGIERDGKIFLFPYDAYVQQERDFNEELTPLSIIYDVLKGAGNPINLVIVDACRDNPWSSPLPITAGMRDGEPQQRPESVELFTSALSGSKAVDGTGNESPYAAAFLEALKTPDADLDAFTRKIGALIDGYRIRDASISIPEVASSPTVDFVLLPSRKTFDQEKEVFDGATQTRNGSALRQLMKNDGGGYFYSAAQTWIKDAPYQPVAYAPTKVVEIPDNTILYDHPDKVISTQKLTYRQTDALVVGKAFSSEGVDWLSVTGPISDKPLFVPQDHVQPSSKPLPTGTTYLSFGTSQNSGTVELSVDDQNVLREIFKGSSASLISKITIIGYQTDKTSADEGDKNLILSRQISVLKAIQNLGFDASTAETKIIHSDDATDVGKIGVVINR